MNDEIDLIIIFNYLKRHIYKIALSGLFSVLLCFIYFAYNPVKYTASLNYSELSKTNSYVFNNINSELNNYFKSKDELTGQTSFVVIDPESIIISFSESLRNPEIIKNTIKNLKIEDNDINIDKFIKNSNVKFVRRVNQYSTNFNFSIKHEEEDIAKQYLIEIFKTASNHTIDRVIKTINDLTAKVKMEKINSVNLIKNQIEIERSFAKKKTEDRIEFLKEHAKLARTLGIEKPDRIAPLAVIMNDNEIGFSKVYLEGYLALEGEIDILSQRTKFDSFIQNIRELEVRIANLVTYDEIEILSFFVNQLDKNIDPITYNYYDITIEKSMSRSILIILSLILGFSITTIILIYHRIYFFRETD